MTHLAYVDCSNLFIEGQKVSAVAKGMTRSLDDSRRRGVLDFDYLLDLHRFMTLLRRAQDETRAVVFGSVTDSNEGLWRHATTDAGFVVVTVRRQSHGRNSNHIQRDRSRAKYQAATLRYPQGLPFGKGGHGQQHGGQALQQAQG